MFQDVFIKLDSSQCETLLKEVNPNLAGSDFDAQTVTVIGHELSFYPGYHYYEIADYEAVPHKRKHIVYKPDDVIALDFTNKPIYALNEKVPLNLTTNNVADYLRFFFKYVRGPHGRFNIVESVDEISWNDEPPPAARKAVGNLLTPVTLNGRNADNAYHLSVCFVHKSTLYKANIFIEENGNVLLNDEEVLIEDLPVLDDTLRQ